MLASSIASAQRTNPSGEYWALVASPPAMRHNHAVAYDAARGKVVMFGGVEAHLPNDETWEWDGRDWTQRRVDGPSARQQFALTYDAARGVVLLFGGLDQDWRYLSDTWEWNGEIWQERAVAGPAVIAPSMAYDSGRGKVVLFGQAIDGTEVNETWEWDGTSWTRQTPSTIPTFTQQHAMAYDAARGKTVLWSGVRGYNEPVADLWEWDGTDWTRRDVPGPSPRIAFDIAYDAARERVVLFGGSPADAGPPDSGTWEWDGTSWSLRAEVGPSRGDHAMAYDGARGRVMLFGGYDAETWDWDGKTWTQRAIRPPASATLLAHDRARNELVAFIPGYVVGSPIFIRRGMEWTRPVVSPLPTVAAGVMAYDEGRDVVVLFGGSSSAGEVEGDETWEWDGESWTLTMPAARPDPRMDGAVAYDRARGKLVLFGGSTSDGGVSRYLGDTWEWDGATWTPRTPATSPSPRAGHAMAYDSARGTVVLYGGHEGANVLADDTWEWDGTDWTLRMPTSNPGPRMYHSMAYNEGRGVVVLMGSFVGDAYAASYTWEWDGSDWTAVTQYGPSPRTHTAMVYDADRDSVVLFGGILRIFGPDPLSLADADTWETIVARGTTCVVAAQCETGQCVDGVCCDHASSACDACQACNVSGSVGTCAPIQCAAADACHEAGVCDPATSTCSSQPVADGTKCDDGDADTRDDACQTGICTGIAVGGEPDPDPEPQPEPDAGSTEPGVDASSPEPDAGIDPELDAGQGMTDRDSGSMQPARDAGADGGPSGRPRKRGHRCAVGVVGAATDGGASIRALAALACLSTLLRRRRARQPGSAAKPRSNS